MTKRLKLTNIRPGHATVIVCTAKGDREVGEVYLASEISNERGDTIHAAGWVPVTLDRISHANPPQFPRCLSRKGAAWMLADGEVTY